MLACLLAVVAPWLAAELRVERWPDGTPRAEFEVRVEADGSEVRHGPWKSWHANGKAHEEGAFADGLAEGEWVVRWPNGKRRAQGSFTAGVREGPWKEFHESGPKAAEGSYRGGRRAGRWSCWGEDKRPDAARSGEYASVARAVGVRGITLEGTTVDGRPIDLWVWRRADGSLRLAGRFGAHGPEGPWVAAFADGSLDLDGQCGEYTAGVRTGPLAGWPAELPELPRETGVDPRRAAPLAVDADVAARLEAWLAAEQGSREGPWREFASEPRAAFVACVAFLQGLDCAEPDERARRVALEALPLLIGVAFPLDASDPARCARRALEWRDHVELSDLDSKAWRALFDPRWRLGRLELAHTPLAARAAPADGPWPGATGTARSRGIFAARGGGAAAEAAGASGTGPAVEAGLAWLARTQAADGSWERSTTRTLEASAWALLALAGTGLDVLDEPASDTRAALARGLTWLIAQQDAGSGRYATSLCYELRSHALALWAAAELAALQSLPALDASVARGLSALLAEQQADGGFPRDAGKREVDVTTTLYAAMALSVLELEGDAALRAPRRAALECIAKLAAADGSLPEPEGRTPAATAASIFLALAGGADAERDDGVRRGVGWMIAHPSNIEPRHPQLDAEYLMFGAWACIQVGGQVWTDWNESMKTQLLQVQKRGAGADGSWEPLGVGVTDVTSVTAQRVLTFQAYDRYTLRGN
jgi:hypothetical protein